jgi:DNA-binding transcriptional MerR regulator
MRKPAGLRIGDVVRRTGLTERAIRHYEAQGLLKAARTAAGQRVYGEDMLRRLAIIRVLKRAGFSLSEIRKLIQSAMPVGAIIDAQLESLQQAAASVQQSIALLKSLRSELQQNPGDASSILGRVAEIAEQCEPDAAWRAVFDRYFANDRQEAWKQLNERLSRAVDPQEHNAAWLGLIADIKSRLPLDPRSSAARKLMARWNKLMEPFNSVATAQQKEEARALWSRAGEWGPSVNHPMTKDVAEFIKSARLEQEAARSKRGKLR